jgi:hypothetical protein
VQRIPLVNAAVSHAGQPSKIGGTLTRGVGWTVLGAGLLLALMFGGLASLFHGGVGFLVVALPLAFLACAAAFGLLRSGSALKKRGEDAESATKNQAIFALATARGGVLKAWDVAQMLHVTPEAADVTLTQLAKGYPDYVKVDVDDEGNVLYRFPSIAWNRVAVTSPHVRVEPREATSHEGMPQEAEFAESDAERARMR